MVSKDEAGHMLHFDGLMNDIDMTAHQYCNPTRKFPRYSSTGNEERRSVGILEESSSALESDGWIDNMIIFSYICIQRVKLN